MLVLVRGARAFSCVGSGVGDPRLVHAAGGDVGRLPVSVYSSINLEPFFNADIPPRNLI